MGLINKDLRQTSEGLRQTSEGLRQTSDGTKVRLTIGKLVQIG